MLKLPTTVRYGTRIVVLLAAQAEHEPVSTRDIAEDQQVSEGYAEQILLKLRTAGIVRSRRGASGGYLLAVDAAETSVADLISAIDGPVSLVSCLDSPCLRDDQCPTREVWQQANDALLAVFSGVTIADLAEKMRQAEGADAPNYQI